MTLRLAVAGLALLGIAACTAEAPTTISQSTAAPPPPAAKGGYLDNTGRPDILEGGVRMIPITTPAGAFKVWTKRVGNNPRIKVLLLHGGPGATHEYFEALDSFFPG